MVEKGNNGPSKQDGGGPVIGPYAQELCAFAVDTSCHYSFHKSVLFSFLPEMPVGAELAPSQVCQLKEEA